MEEEALEDLPDMEVVGLEAHHHTADQDLGDHHMEVEDLEVHHTVDQDSEDHHMEEWEVHHTVDQDSEDQGMDQDQDMDHLQGMDQDQDMDHQDTDQGMDHLHLEVDLEAQEDLYVVV